MSARAGPGTPGKTLWGARPEPHGIRRLRGGLFSTGLRAFRPMAAAQFHGAGNRRIGASDAYQHDHAEDAACGAGHSTRSHAVADLGFADRWSAHRGTHDSA